MPQVIDNSETTIAELVDAIQKRSTTTRWGIGTVSHYLKSCEAFLPAEITKSNDWSLALKRAETLLSWCDEEMCDADLIAKSVQGFSDGTDVPSGFCATMEGVLTSNRKDRDGDILEPKGLVVDAQMPLLWQHIPMQPTGRCLQVLGHDEKCIKVKWGLVDTLFGRDNAILCQAGCLRFSHGFKAFEVEPIQHKAATDGVPSGWHVLKGEIREGSIVSIPSNVDAVITAFSQGKLTTPVMKSWAKQFYDARPVVVPVTIDLTVKAGNETVHLGNMAGEMTNKTPEQTDEGQMMKMEAGKGSVTETGEVGGANGNGENASELANKSVDVVQKTTPASLTTKMYTESELEGSFEDIRDKLNASLLLYLQSKKVSGITSDSYAYVMATFSDSAIVAVNVNYSGRKYYRLAWKQGESGPEWDGDLQEVEIKPVVIEKCLASAQLMVKGLGGGTLVVKEGRTISADTFSKLSAARDKMSEAHGIIHELVEGNKPASGASGGANTTSGPSTASTTSATTTSSTSSAAGKTNTGTGADTGLPFATANANDANTTPETLANAIAAKAFGMADTDVAINALKAAQDKLNKAVEVLRGQQLGALLG